MRCVISGLHKLLDCTEQYHKKPGKAQGGLGQRWRLKFSRIALDLPMRSKFKMWFGIFFLYYSLCSIWVACDACSTEQVKHSKKTKNV